MTYQSQLEATQGLVLYGSCTYLYRSFQDIEEETKQSLFMVIEYIREVSIAEQWDLKSNQKDQRSPCTVPIF